MSITPAEAMPFCGEFSCHTEDRQSHSGQLDTKGITAFLKAQFSPRRRWVFTVGVSRGSLLPEEEWRGRIRAVIGLREILRDMVITVQLMLSSVPPMFSFPESCFA